MSLLSHFHHVIMEEKSTGAVTSEDLAIVSNFLVAGTTLLLWWTSMREDHKTIRRLTNIIASMARRQQRPNYKHRRNEGGKGK